jgi:hypothetical protein
MGEPFPEADLDLSKEPSELVTLLKLGINPVLRLVITIVRLVVKLVGETKSDPGLDSQLYPVVGYNYINVIRDTEDFIMLSWEGILGW